MGGSSGSSTTTVKKLPDYAEPYVQSFLERAYALCLETFIPYWDPSNGSPPTYAAQTADETQAITGLATRGRNGNTTITKGITLLESIIDGDQLPGTDAEFQAALTLFHDTFANAVTNEVIPTLGGTLYYVGDLSAENLAQTLTAEFVAAYSSRSQKAMTARNYKRARTDQLRILSMGVEYAAQPYADADMLRTAGLQQREYDQGALDDLYKRWFEEQIGPINKLEILGNAIRAMVGTQYKTTSPLYKPSQVVAMVGGGVAMGVAGYMAASAAYGSTAGPYGAAIGAVVGLALGAMSSR